MLPRSATPYFMPPYLVETNGRAYSYCRFHLSYTFWTVVMDSSIRNSQLLASHSHKVVPNATSLCEKKCLKMNEIPFFANMKWYLQFLNGAKCSPCNVYNPTPFLRILSATARLKKIIGSILPAKRVRNVVFHKYREDHLINSNSKLYKRCALKRR